MLVSLIAAAAMQMPSHARYLGQPDLQLTSALVQAGGGPAHFSSQKLFVYLAGPVATTESEALVRKYGKQQVMQFFTTFDAFIDSAISAVQSSGKSLPAAAVPSADKLSADLYKAGVMPDGRYDVGYMIEHLISRPMHVQLMHKVNDDPSIGPQNNAQFHVILTNAVQDLHKYYSKA